MHSSNTELDCFILGHRVTFLGLTECRGCQGVTSHVLNDFTIAFSRVQGSQPLE
jgi:hypothetical protein